VHITPWNKRPVIEMAHVQTHGGEQPIELLAREEMVGGQMACLYPQPGSQPAIPQVLAIGGQADEAPSRLEYPKHTGADSCLIRYVFQHTYTKYYVHRCVRHRVQALTMVDVKVKPGQPVVTRHVLTREPHHGRREIHANAAAESMCQSLEVPAVAAANLQNGIRWPKTGIPSDQR